MIIRKTRGLRIRDQFQDSYQPDCNIFQITKFPDSNHVVLKNIKTKKKTYTSINKIKKDLEELKLWPRAERPGIYESKVNV